MCYHSPPGITNKVNNTTNDYLLNNYNIFVTLHHIQILNYNIYNRKASILDPSMFLYEMNSILC